MKRYLVVGAVMMAGVLSAPLAASAQDQSWLMDLQNPSCSTESRQTIADQVRKQIEDSVARATASIKPPAAVGDLGCLNDLMNAPLDSFSNMGGILGDLTGGLTGAINDAQNDVSRQVCQFAADKWGAVTDPLTESMDEISGVGSDVWDNFDLINNGSRPSNSGSRSPVTSPGETTVPAPEDDADTPTVEQPAPPAPEVEIPVYEGCTPVMVADGLCLAPAAPAPANAANANSVQDAIWGAMGGTN